MEEPPWLRSSEGTERFALFFHHHRGPAGPADPSPHRHTHAETIPSAPGLGFPQRAERQTHPRHPFPGEGPCSSQEDKAKGKATLEIKPHPCSCHCTLSAGNPGARRVNPQGSAPTLTHPVHEYFRQRKQDPGPSPFPWVQGQIQAPPTPCLTGHSCRREDRLWR